jgi:hypothetical protein
MRYLINDSTSSISYFDGVLTKAQKSITWYLKKESRQHNVSFLPGRCQIELTRKRTTVQWYWADDKLERFVSIFTSDYQKTSDLQDLNMMTCKNEKESKSIERFVIVLSYLLTWSVISALRLSDLPRRSPRWGYSTRVSRLAEDVSASSLH